MVDFAIKDRIEEIRKIIAQQKADEDELKKLEEELIKKKEELEKKKNEKKIDEILEDALKKESEEYDESEKTFRRTNIQLQESQKKEESEIKNIRLENSLNVEENTHKENDEQVIYRQMNQVSNVEDMYQQLEDIYRQIPQSKGREVAFQSQRQIYHELKVIADKWSSHASEETNKENSPSFYGRKISQNTNNESSTWQRLSERVKEMAQEAGNDKYNYQIRTETVLNQLRHKFEDREYNIQEDRKDIK